MVNGAFVKYGAIRPQTFQECKDDGWSTAKRCCEVLDKPHRMG
jgi:hypothetical protein